MKVHIKNDRKIIARSFSNAIHSTRSKERERESKGLLPNESVCQVSNIVVKSKSGLQFTKYITNFLPSVLVLRHVITTIMSTFKDVFAAKLHTKNDRKIIARRFSNTTHSIRSKDSMHDQFL